MSPIKNISLYIPHIFANYSKDDVAEIFMDKEIGDVKCVDFISKMGNDGNPFNAAYIHFNCWFNNSIAANFQERVLNPSKDAHLMYDAPWYWIVLENKARKIAPGDRKPRIDLSELTPLPKSAPLLKPSSLKTFSLNNKKVTINMCTHAVEKSHEAPEVSQDEIDDAFLQFVEEEIEAEVAEQEDVHLITIDGRYVQALETELNMAKMHASQLYNSYYLETLKSQALAEAFKMVKS